MLDADLKCRFHFRHTRRGRGRLVLLGGNQTTPSALSSWRRRATEVAPEQ